MTVSLTALRALLFTQPFTQPGSRGRDRIRRAGLTSVTSMISQGLIIGTGMVSVPLTVHYLGTERYGIWLTLNSLWNWLAITNLGFGGNALVNKLSEANGRDDRQSARELVATAFWTLMAIAAALGVILALAFKFVPWGAVFNAAGTLESPELHRAVIISMVCFVLLFPISLVDAIYQGHQQGYIANIWGMGASLASLIALVCVTRAKGGLPMLVLALSGARIILAVANLCYLFGRQYPWLLPLPGAVSRRSLRDLLSLGLKYFAAQMAGIGMFQSQPMIIAQILGPAQVGLFNIAQRLLTLPMLVVQMFTFPLMPAYGEAQARRDWHWVRHSLWRTLAISAAGTTVMVGCLALLAKPVIRIWVGPQAVPGTGLILGLSSYVLVTAFVTPASVMLYGVQRAGGQAIIAGLNAVFTVAGGIILTRSLGTAGMAAAMAFALFAVNLVGQAIQTRQVFNSIGSASPDGVPGAVPGAAPGAVPGAARILRATALGEERSS
jgi:O-antigen/teichoic acid export membrane protein